MTDPVVYVASRASVPSRPAMWKTLRRLGWQISSTWIDEAGEGETSDFGELWARIEKEISASDGLILYAEVGDFPLKGALVEVGMALAMKKPVAIVLGGGLSLELRTLRPLGSWAAHPFCSIFDNLDSAWEAIAKAEGGAA